MMRRIFLALGLIVVLAKPAFPLHLEGSLDIGTGGGYDDNLNHASSHRQAEGAAFATSWIMVNASKDMGENGRYFVGAGYEGIYYPSFTDLTVNGFTVRGGLSYSVSKRMIVNGRAFWGARTYGDRDRDATVYGVSLGMKNQVYQKFAVRMGYQYTKNAAEEDVFSYDANRFSVSGEMNVSKTAYLALGYVLELTESTFYQPATAPTPSGAHGRRPSTTFGANQVVLKADSLAHVFSVDWEQDIYDGIYGLLGYAHSYVQRDPENYQDNFVSGKVGYRF
jgi:hypothetical protein